jgi:uncharacterized protein (DUF1501 family)
MAKRLTRRQFLKHSATAAVTAAVAPQLRLIPGTNVAWASGPGDAIVVIVQLFGGNDGINTVYPLTNVSGSDRQRDKYTEFRPTLALPNTNAGLAPWQNAGFPVSSVLSLGANTNGTQYALNPGMSALHTLYTQGKLAVCNGVHYPYADHSHFRSEEIWYALDPLGTSRLGWMGKYMTYAGFPPTAVPAVVLGDSINPAFTPNTTSIFAFRRLSDLQFPAFGEAALKQAKLRQLYDLADDSNPALFPELVKIGQTGVATSDTMQQYFLPGDGLANAGKVEKLLLDPDGDYSRRNPLVYSSPLNADVNPQIPDSSLVRDMRHVAATIRANVGARFFHVGTGGFDSHSSQDLPENDFYHSRLLQDVSESIAALYNDLAQPSITLPGGYSGYLTGSLASKILIVTVSEFGRTIRQNAYSPGSAGTDHATSAPQFVLGGAVIGGQYGAYPHLDDPGAENEDDLKMSIDIRDLYGTILNRWLNVTVAALGPGPGKILVDTPTPDSDGKVYTTFTPLGFLAP